MAAFAERGRSAFYGSAADARPLELREAFQAFGQRVPEAGKAWLSQLRGVNFEWKHPADHANQTGLQGGFIAQEVAAVFPKWVTDVDAAEHDKALTDDGKIKSLSLPFQFDALVVEAVKQLSAQIKAKEA